MRITRLSTAVLEANFDWTIVKLETDTGLVGLGEAFLGPGLPAIIAEYSVLLEGQNPLQIDPLMRRLRSASVHAGTGMVWHAIGGIETALLDIVGQHLGVPIWQLLGGKYRDSVRIYCDCHAGDALESIGPLVTPRVPHWMQVPGEAATKSILSLKHHGWDASKAGECTPEGYAARAAEMVERGFTLIKFDVDVPTPYDTDEYNRDLSRAEIEYAITLVHAVREAVGPHVGLAIDCHWNYHTAAAIAMAQALEPFGLLWLEDPMPPENIRAIGEVQRATRTPIATGENHFYRYDFQRLITEAGLRLLAPDVQKLGLWEGRKMADMAEMQYVNITWHNVSSPVGTMAGVHLSAAIPNFLALEWHAASVPFFDELMLDHPGPLIRDGRIAVPSAPGLGMRLNEEVARQYQKPGTSWF